MGAETSYRVGVDIGGTFTDIVVLGSDGSLQARKVASTPDDYSRGIAEGIDALLDEIGADAAQIERFVHATTVATNTILQYKGARTGLVTTRGFRDILEMRRLRIPVLYDLQYEKPPALVERALRLEVDERIGPRGEVWVPLDEASVVAAGNRLKTAGVEAVTVSLLHSYANSAHEERVAEILRSILGQEVFLTRSSEILPEIREYERTSTAVVNAYIGPVVARYLRTLIGRLNDVRVRCPIQVMLSSGGVMAVDRAIAKPVYLVESGPAAGAIACARVARALDLQNVISIDMGGTTAKAALIEGGQPAKTAEYEIGAGINLSSKLIKGTGHPIKLPFIDVSEIGAGGGSLIAVDEHGLASVGPESAGASPGPVCYDQGGVIPTLTDALVALGFLNPRYLVGGELPLNTPKAVEALERVLARPLDKPLADAAYGILTLACAKMTRAVKAVTTYRGRDPRNCVLVAFGGNGPVVGAEIARALHIRRLLVPPSPGVFSALGLLYSDVEQEFSRTVLGRLNPPTAEAIAAAFESLEADALAAMCGQGYAADEVELRRFAQLRYSGQAYELPIPVCPGLPDPARMAIQFGEEHERTYGHRSDRDPVDLVNIVVNARIPAAAEPERPVSTASGEAAERLVFFGPVIGTVPTPVVARQALAGDARAGPLVVEEYDATCVIPPGCTAHLDHLGNIDIAVDV